MKITCKDFKDTYTHLNTEPHDIQFSWPQLRHAVVTMGSPSLRAAMPSTHHAFAFALHKIFALESVIEIDEQGTLKLPDRYEDLDQSEKGVLSYWLGMCITKVVAAEILDVPWPVHLRHFMKAIEVTLNSKKLPDYVGLDSNGEWHVLEAKGWQPKPSETVCNRWKAQVGSISQISCKDPETRSYCFTRVNRPISIELVDPPLNNDDEKINLLIKPEQCQRFYYQPYLDLFSDELQHGNKSDVHSMLYKSVGFDSLNRIKYSIAVDRSILEKVLRNELVKKTNPVLTDDWYLGSDGIGLKKEEATEADCIEFHRRK